jgi:NADH-quinone oxidoreductase subunit H
MIDLAFILEVVVICVKVGVIGMSLFGAPVILTWVERKVAGHMQVRLGPMRVGPHGLMQALADMIKMIFTEDMIPDRADKWLFKIAPLIMMIPVFAIFVAIPIGPAFDLPIVGTRITLWISDMNVGVIYILAVAGISIYGMIFAGWASNSKYALMGGMRAAAQMISYEVAMTFAVVGVVMMSGSLSLVDIVESQGGGFWHWNIFYLPVGFIWFIIFIIAGLAEMNRIPFDLPEDEGSLAAGYHVEYSGMRFAYFALAEYVTMVAISCLTVVFFLGGWDDPSGIGFLPPVLWFLGKVGFFILFFMWVRFTLPRYRYDQLMTIGWKILIPISLVTVLLTGFMKIA